MGLFKYILPALCMVQTVALAQFAPQAGVTGSTAISKYSNDIDGWATGCVIIRGWMDIADPSLGKASLGDDSKGIGMSDNAVVSLGDSGIAVLTFESPIYNGPGADFAVFENGFTDPADPEEAFLELTFVEVSSDGVRYVRFPAASHAPVSPQVPMAGVYANARHFYNLAGKYAAAYGTPFDLQELVDSAGLDINRITHVRLVDVIGSTGAHASRDADGRIINDPYPTPISGSGFDLDAVAAMHLRSVGIAERTGSSRVRIYPNPVTDVLMVSVKDNEPLTMVVTDIAGKVLHTAALAATDNRISFASYRSGIYYLQLSDTKGNKWVEKITRL